MLSEVECLALGEHEPSGEGEWISSVAPAVEGTIPESDRLE